MAKVKKKKNVESELPVATADPDTSTTAPGERGVVGISTPALKVKQLWRQETHLRQNVGDKRNPRKQAWIKKKGTPSLLEFARKLAASGNQDAKDWFANKKGACNQKRSDKNIARITLEKQASKNARRKTSGKAAKPTEGTSK